MHYRRKDPVLTSGNYLFNQNLPFMQDHLNDPAQCFPD
jgi:hypothetical protein